MPKTELTTRLLKAIVESFTDHPEALNIQMTDRPGAVYWTIQAHLDDTPFVIGRGGSHIKALQFVMTELGELHGRRYRLNVDEPKPGIQSDPRQVQPPADYDPAQALAFLRWIISELVTECPPIEVERLPATDRPSFIFNIKPESEFTCKQLVAPYEGDLKNQTLIGAIGTLFRAFARKQGTDFRIQVIDPAPLEAKT